MKEKNLHCWRSCRAWLPLLCLLLPRSSAAIDLVKDHKELHGIHGWPGYSWDESYSQGLPGGITVGADLGFKLSATFAEVKFKGDACLSYTNWPGPANLWFTNTSGEASMALGFKAWAKGKLAYRGWGFNAGWPIGWVQVIPKVTVTRKFADVNLPALDDEASCTNYLLGTSVALSDDTEESIEIYKKEIKLEPIFSTNDLMATVTIGLTPGLGSTIKGLRLSSSAATFTNTLPQIVSLPEGDTFVVSNIVVTSSNIISLRFTPNLSIGYKAPGIEADLIMFPILTISVPIDSSTFDTAPRTVTFHNPNLAQAVTLAASETVCAGTNASATLNGTVNAGGVVATAGFEWGTTTNYGQTVALTDTGDGTNDMSLTYKLTGLEPGVKYHYRAVVTNSLGWKAGEDRTFGPLFLALAGEDLLILPPGTPFTDPGTGLAGLSPAQAISAGHAHSLALLADGNVAAWGDNRYGQSTVPAGLTDVTAIAAGGNQSLALNSNGTVWGAGDPGVFGNALEFSKAGSVYTNSDYVRVSGLGSHLPSNGPVTVEFWQRVRQQTNQMAFMLEGAPATGRFLAHVAYTDGKVYWDFGDISNGGRLSYTPSNSIVGTWQHFALVAKAGSGGYMRIYRNGILEASKASAAATYTPGAYDLLLAQSLGGFGDLDEFRIWNVARTTNEIQADMMHSLTGTEPGLVAYWKFDEGTGTIAYDATTNHCDGTLVNGPTWVPRWSEFGEPVIPAGVTNVAAIAAGYNHGLALKTNGTVIGWGDNSSGQTNVPAGLTNVTAIAAGAAHSLALKNDGTLVGWGAGGPGASGYALELDGTTNQYLKVTNFSGFPSNAITVEMWMKTSATNDGSPFSYAVGTTYNEFLVFSTRNMSVAVSNTSSGVPQPPIMVNDGAWHHVAVTWRSSDGRLETYVDGTSRYSTNIQAGYVLHSGGFLVLGQDQDSLGGKFDTNQAFQGQMDEVRIWKVARSQADILADMLHPLAGTEPDLVAYWKFDEGAGSTATNSASTGSVYNGALVGNPKREAGWSDFSQTAIPASATNVMAIAAGAWHSLALQSNGTVVAWGLTNRGQCVRPAGLTDVVAVAAGAFHSLALREDGTVVGWGDNSFGQTNPPTAATNVVAIAAGDFHNLALRSDGTMVAWGWSDSGQAEVPLRLSGTTIGVTGTVNTNVPGVYTLSYWLTNAPGVISSVTRTVVVAGAPIATTLAPSDLLTVETSASVTLNGLVNPLALPTTAWFEWSTNLSHWNSTPAVDMGDGWNPQPVAAVLTNLMAGVNYQCRLVASNSAGIAYGSVQIVRPPYLYLSGDDPLIWPVGSPFEDPGFAVMPMAVAGGGLHSLALQADGSVVGWGYNVQGQTNVPPDATNTVAIAAGKFHSLALQADGSVVSWGYSGHGETNVPPGATNEVVAIAAGIFHSLALRADGTLIAWGRNDFYQTFIPFSATNVVAIAAGGSHCLALRADGALIGWGRNDFDQISIPDSATNGVVAITAGESHSLALKADGSVVGWGAGTFVADPTDNVNYGQIMIPASATNGVVAIAAGGYHNLAVRADGSVVGWGNSDYGQTNAPAGLGDIIGDIGISSDVVDTNVGQYTITYWVTNTLGAVATATRTVAVAAPPEVFTWGASDVFSDGTNASATLTGTVNPNAIPTSAWFEWGTNLSYGHSTPVMGVGEGWDPQPIIAAATELTAGITNHFRAAASNSLGVVYGEDRPIFPLLLTLNEFAPSVLSCPADAADPCASVANPARIPLRAIAAGGVFSMGLRKDGTICGWGHGGDGTGEITNAPVGLSNVTAIAAGNQHALALRADGSVVGWGYNDYGQTDVPPSATNEVVAIAAGVDHSLALKADGSVVGWGDNYAGQTAIPDGATNGVVAIAAGYGHSLALKADGSVVGWGDNSYGQTAIPDGATNGVVAIAAGWDHSLALKADGSVVGWGANYGGLTTIPDGATNGVVAIAAGGFHNLALKADGSVVAWGENASGQTDVPPSATYGVAAIAGSYEQSLALKTDGSVVGWGYNANGQVDAPAVYCNPPVTVTGVPVTNAPGYYTLTYWATNVMDAVATTTRTVQVLNPNPPLVTLNGPSSMMVGLGYAFTDPGATALEPCSGTNLPVTVTGSVDTTNAGAYTLTYQAANLLGAIGTTNRTVNVVPDTTPPLVTCPDVVATALPGECEASVFFFVSATDDWDPAPVVTCVPPSGSMFPVGRTTVVGTARDAAGNTSTCSFMVSVYPSNEGGPTGETWTARESNRSWYSVASSADGMRLVAAADGGPIFTSTDGGTNWIGRESSRHWWSVASSADGLRLVAVPDYGQIYTSTDGGTNWTARESYRFWRSVASSADGLRLVAVVYSGQIYTSTDGGTNWTARASNRDWLSVASSADGTRLVAAVYSGQIYTSTDGGTNWTARASNRSWVSVASSADGLRLVAVPNYGQIYTSTDGGTNWIGRASSRHWWSVASSAAGLRLVAAVSGGQIYTSTDGGTNWTARESYRFWRSVASSADGLRLVAVEYGGQIYTSVGALPLTNPPTILGAANQVLAATGPEGAVATFNVTATNICQPFVPVTCTPLSGSLFPPGTNTVFCEAVDALGVTNTTTFTVTVLLPGQPVFGGYSVSAPGQFQLEGTGTAGLTYTLQSSTNLVNWVDRTNLVADPGGAIECLLTMETNAPACFYRLRWP